MFVNNSGDVDWNILLVLNNVYVEKYIQIFLKDFFGNLNS